MQGDADAGFEAEDGFEDDGAALDCHGEECKLAAITAVFDQPSFLCLNVCR